MEGLHANHPAMGIRAPPSQPAPQPVPEPPAVGNLQQQVATLVLENRAHVEKVARLEEKLAVANRRADTLEALCACDERVRTRGGSSVAQEVTPGRPAEQMSSTPARRDHFGTPAVGSSTTPTALVPVRPSATPASPVPPPRPLRRSLSLVTTDKDRHDAVQPLLMNRTRALQEAMTEVVEVSSQVTRHWHEDNAEFTYQIEQLKQKVETLESENVDLRRRVAEDVLHRRMTANMTNVLAKLKSQRRTREASLLRLEALEQSAMMAHDDEAYVRRWTARKFPNDRVALAYVDFVPFGALAATVPHIERLVMELYYQTLAVATEDTQAVWNHTRGASALFILPCAIDALAFVTRVNDLLLSQEWPDSLLHEPHFGRVADPATGKVVFRGPRARAGLHFGSVTCEFDSKRGQYYGFGQEVTAAGRVAALARPGEFCTSSVFKERLEQELAGLSASESPFGDLAQWAGPTVTRQQTSISSLVPPDFQSRRATWKRDYPSTSALRAAVPEWSAKMESVLHWGKIVGVGPALVAPKLTQRGMKRTPSHRNGPPAGSSSPASQRLSIAAGQSLTSAPAGLPPLGAAAYDSPKGLGDHQEVATSHSFEAAPGALLGSAVNATRVFEASSSRTMSVSAPGVVIGGGSSVASTPAASSGKQVVRLRALLCNAERSLEAIERSRMETFDYIAQASNRAPPQQPHMIVGRMADAAALQAKMQSADFGDSLRLLLAEAKQATARHGGYWVKSEDEFFMAVFTRLVDAVEMANGLHVALLRVSWPASAMRHSPFVSVQATDADGQPVKRPVSGGVMAAMALQHCVVSQPVIDGATGRTDYIGLSVHIACQLAVHSRPGETLVAESAMSELKQARFVVEHSLNGQGLHELASVQKPEDATTILPLELGARYRIWASQTKGADKPGAPAPGGAAAKDRALTLKAIPDREVSVRMRHFLRLHKDTEAIKDIEKDARRASARRESWALQALVSVDGSPSSISPSIARALRMVPKLREDRRRLLRKLQNVETAEMLSHDNANISVPHVGHAAIVVLDLEGSEVLFKTFGDVFVAAQRHFNALVLSIAADFEGYRVKHNGYDAFVYALCNAAVALRFCNAVQNALLHVEWPQELYRHDLAIRIKDVATGVTHYSGLRCRMGIATGKVTTVYDPHTQRTDYTGNVVHTAGRVARYGRGGDVVASPETMSDLQRIEAESDGEALAGIAIVPRKEPSTKGQPLYWVYALALSGRQKNLLSRQSKRDEEKVSNWWRGSHTCTTVVNSGLMTPQIIAEAQQALVSTKSSEKAGDKRRSPRAQAGPAASARAGSVAGPLAATAPASTPPAAAAALASLPPIKTSDAQPTSSSAASSGKNATQKGSSSALRRTTSGHSASGTPRNRGTPKGDASMRSGSFERKESSVSVTPPPAPPPPAHLSEAQATKLTDVCRRLLARMESTQEATFAVPSFKVSSAKVARELGDVLTATNAVVQAVAPWTLSGGKAKTSAAISSALDAYAQLADRSVDLKDDEERARQAAIMHEARQAVCQRCGAVFRNALYCSVTGMLHHPRSSFYVYNLHSNIISVDDVRLIADVFARVDEHEFGRLSFVEVQTLVAEFGEALDEQTYFKRMCRDPDGCVSLEDIVQYVFPTAKSNQVMGVINEALMPPPSTPDMMLNSADSDSAAVDRLSPTQEMSKANVKPTDLKELSDSDVLDGSRDRQNSHLVTAQDWANPFE